MDDGAVRSLDLDIAFPEQLPVGSVLVVDLVEGYLVVDVPDVLESLGQFNVAIGEVEIQFRELAEPGLLHVALGPGLPGCGHGGFRLLPCRPDPLHLVGGEQFLGYGMVDIVPPHDSWDAPPHGRYLAFGEEHLLCEHAHAARRGDEQFAQGCADSGCECGVRFEALSDEPVVVGVGVHAPVGVEQPRQSPVFHAHNGHCFQKVIYIL